jgi:FkbM family methyltransferase
MNKLKQFIKSALKYLHIDLTSNMKYDRQASKIIKKVLKKDSSTIDVGCHKGEMLDEFIVSSPEGKHFAFEPIPALFNNLKHRFNSPNITVFPFALAEKSGEAEFNFVKNAPAYSGLKKRKYAIDNPEIEKIPVIVKTLDEVIDGNQKIDLIKIDVEGAEFGVLKGAKNTIIKNKPIIIFECGLGASEFYDTKPELVFAFLVHECGLHLSTMKNWLKKENSLQENEFCEIYRENKEYYFVAYP